MAKKIKVKALIKDNSSEWVETFDVISKATAIKEIKEVCEFFNDTLKEGEEPRIFVMLVKLKFVVVNITSWVGISINAQHHYADFCEYEEKGLNIPLDDAEEWSTSTWNKIEKLTKPLTKEEATELAEKDSYLGIGSYKEGDMTERFNTYEEVFKAAEKYYKENRYKVPMVILKEGSHFREPKIMFN